MVSLGVVKLGPDEFNDCLTPTAQLAVVVERRTDIAERDFRLGHLMAGITVAAIDRPDRDRGVQAASVLGNGLIDRPVAEILAVGRKDDAGQRPSVVTPKPAFDMNPWFDAAAIPASPWKW